MIQKGQQPQFIELKMDSQIDQERNFQSTNEFNQNAYLKAPPINTQSKANLAKIHPFSPINKFINSKTIICFFLVSLMILASFNCLFQQQALKKQEEITVQNILDSQNRISKQKNIEESIRNQDQNLNRQVQKLSHMISSLESKLIQLKNQVKEQKKKQISLMQTKAKGINKERQSKNKFDGIPKYRIRQNPQTNISKVQFKDLYEFNKSMNQIVHHSSMKVIYRNKNISQGIQKQTFQRAIRLMEVTHNIDIKGHFVMDHFRFYYNPKQKYQVLSQLLDQEKLYFDRKYQIHEYIHQQIGMCIFVHSQNNTNNRLYLRSLDSIFQQDYQNYHLVYVNDASIDDTDSLVLQYMEVNQIPKSKYTIINNHKRLNFAYNAYMAAYNHCQLGEIMVFLDGKDSFIGRQVLSLLNAVYQKEKVTLTYGSFLQVEDSKVTKGFSQQISSQYLKNGRIRQNHVSLISPLRTMYVNVMRLIKEADLQDENGNFYQIGCQMALMTSALQLVGTKIKFIPELIYEHRAELQLNDRIKQQRQIQNQVWKKDSSLRLESMSFADCPITVYYP